MNQCPECGHSRQNDALICPECGRYYSKIIELIEQTAAEEAEQTWQGRWQKIKQAEQPWQAITAEWLSFKASLSKTAWFTLGCIALFLFALIVTVL